MCGSPVGNVFFRDCGVRCSIGVNDVDDEHCMTIKYLAPDRRVLLGEFDLTGAGRTKRLNDNEVLRRFGLGSSTGPVATQLSHELIASTSQSNPRTRRG